MQRCRREEWRGAGWVSACSTRSASCPSRWPPRAGWRSRSPAQLAGLRRARRAQLAAHAAAPYQRRVRLGSAELREDEGCGGHEQEELGHRDPLLTAVLHLRVLRAPDQRAISDDGRELTAQSFLSVRGGTRGGDGRGRPSAPRSRWPAATTRPSPSPAPGTTHPRPQLSPAAASPGRSDRGSAHHEMRAVLVVREGGERALGRGGAAAPRAEAHRALELAPDRILPPPQRVAVRARREESDKKRDGSVR